MINARDVIAADLDYMSANLAEELGMLAGKRLLITGGAGFLGYYLVQLLLYWNGTAGKDNAVSVVVHDNYIRGLPPWLKEIAGDKHLTLVQRDVACPLPQDAGDFDFIIHAASIASPSYYRQYPIATMDANVNGLRSLLDYCRGHREKGKRVEGFLFFSSSEIYGDPPPEKIPTPEDYNGNVSCTGPRACYDESKRYGETLCVNFTRVYDLPVRIVRPFNNYGPGLRLDDRRVIPDFARNILHNEDVIMYSDGSPLRTFCYVADAMVGYYKALLRGKPGEPYNIGVPAPMISIGELAERMVVLARDLLRYRGKVVRRQNTDPNYLRHNPTRRCPMITRATEQLDYHPQISLEEGLRRSLIWYRENGEGEGSR